MEENILIIAAAKEYAGFKPTVDPNDSDERYYQAQKCAVYDAFIAGANAVEELGILK